MFRGPLFLVGMPRSGTKLLRGLLNEHSAVGIPLNETEFLPDWLRRWSQFGDLSQRETFHAFYQQVVGSVYFVHRLEEHGACIDRDIWFDACTDFTPQAVFEGLIRHDAAVAASSDGIWGDKSPGYLAHLPLLKDAFPEARFIHIIRDVRDYCLSMKKAFGKSARRAAQRWRDRIQAARQQAQAFPHDYVEVRYEDLLIDPEPELRRLCLLLERDFEPGMLQLSRATENIGDARGRSSIKKDNAGKWRQQLSAERQKMIEQLTRDVLISLDYPITFADAGMRRLSSGEMLALQVHDGLQLIRRETAKRGLIEAVRFRLRIFRETGALSS